MGRLYSPTGEPLSPLVGPGGSEGADGVGEPQRTMRFITHVEANAAAQMRRERIREAVLYTNMRPCLEADGCAENVRHTLPAGYRLTVVQVFPGGGVKVHRIDGTGEALQ